ncbi:MAG: hypothetical protein HY551_05965 [Elusimicrobia bacterium]|nr:hypothetical protein [Elusimicrobiota bacterium]
MKTVRLGLEKPGAVFLSLLLCWMSATPAVLAQERRGEAEVSVPIQGQQPQGPAPATAGGEDDPAEAAPAAGRNIRGVQIGSEPSGPPAPRTPKDPMETKVTVRVKDVPLATFLETISAQAKVNFIITEGLDKKRVTAFLQGINVRDALQTLLEMRGLTYTRVGRSNTYVISQRSRKAPNRITRIYTLNHIPLVSVLTPVSNQAGGGADASAAGGGGLSMGASPGSAGGPAGASGGSASEAGGILKIIWNILTKEGRVNVDPRTNSLVVTDIAEVFPQVEQIIAELDRKAPQIMIEVQIVEINSDRTQQLGIEWGGADGQLAAFQGGSRETPFPFNLQSNASKIRFFDSGTVKNGIVDLTQLTVILRALVSRSEARFLGKPKVMTLNNKTAMIQVSQDTAIGRQATQTSVGNTGGASSINSAERRPTGLLLKVTPQVNRENYITMQVEPTYVNVIQSSLGSDILDPINRSASSMVRVKNGQTLVLGGLLSSRENKIVRKVPILGYLPIIGWFFTSLSTQRNNTDLVIFITPTTVND